MSYTNLRVSRLCLQKYRTLIGYKKDMGHGAANQSASISTAMLL